MKDSEVNKLISEIREASKLLKANRRGEALLIYHDLKERTERNPGVEIQLGHLCEEFGDIDEAVLHYEIVVEQVPDNAHFLTTLGVAYLNAQMLGKAKEALEQALEVDPTISEVQHGLGVYYMQRSDFDSAVPLLEEACKLKPSDTTCRVNLATSLQNLNRHDEALKHIERALKPDQSNPRALMAKSDILAQVGDMEAATRLVEGILKKDPTLGRAYDHYARMKKFTKEDAPFMKKAEKVLEKGMPPKERSSLLFALGKMHDDCGEYDKAFSFFQRGNKLRETGFSFKDDQKIRKATLKAFTRRSIETYAEFGNPSEQPVFIVGMPRSGTTLMERIIASHPQGAGSGELLEIPDIAHKLLPMETLRNPAQHVRKELTPETSAEHAEGYLNILRQGHDDPKRVVDKMPGNARFLGLIKSLFPNATIIHALRNPLDSCLSCYFQNFASLHWTVDLELLGKTYVSYRNSMEYWQEVLPEGSICEVRYEDLVEDPETHARRMIDACGLDWDPSVLEFYRKKGVVRTASIAQTRQKIYKTSRARWMNYAKHVEPLVAEIAPYLEDDRELLAEHGIELPSGSGLLKRLFG